MQDYSLKTAESFLFEKEVNSKLKLEEKRGLMTTITSACQTRIHYQRNMQLYFGTSRSKDSM